MMAKHLEINKLATREATNAHFNVMKTFQAECINRTVRVAGLGQSGLLHVNYRPYAITQENSVIDLESC